MAVAAPASAPATGTTAPESEGKGGWLGLLLNQ